MKRDEFEESKTFNLSDVLNYERNNIIINNIVTNNGCAIQALSFDFGKTLSYHKSSSLRFIYIIEGKAEVVINNNSTFMQKGDSILIPAHTDSSVEANHQFKMICITMNNS
ncbi:cupin domain-containing protein [uncultured Kordia sp.]|uniref:cupin domain-containing protein n=1 Tax=uncultured Kordia sp. TaxID=507699 RepID=UPI0026081710|nr:cupin domain-containing protein [uncultured Kordia sp.]